MAMDLSRVKIHNLQLVYRTNRCTKWMLELIYPTNNPVSIYITRPVNETAERLKSLIRSARNVNHLLLQTEINGYTC